MLLDRAFVDCGKLAVCFFRKPRQFGYCGVGQNLRGLRCAGDDGRYRVMVENPTLRELRHRHAFGYKSLDELCQLRTLCQWQSGERLTHIERVSVRVVVAMIVLGKLRFSRELPRRWFKI